MSSKKRSFDKEILVVGNYCHDRLIHSVGQERRALGGSASYISAVLTALKVDYVVAAVVGDDFKYADQVTHAPRIAYGAKTTEFTADFTQGERILTLGAVAPPILPDDLHDSARVALACGVANELLPATLERLAATCEFVLADIQGLIRGTDVKKRVIHRQLMETPFQALLDRITMLKASEIEAESLDVTATRKQTCLVITRGNQGCTVLTANEEINIPAFPVKEIDPTGAGDCFMAGFAIGLMNGMSLSDCANLANWCGAQAVQQMGVPRLSLVDAPLLAQ